MAESEAQLDEMINQLENKVESNPQESGDGLDENIASPLGFTMSSKVKAAIFILPFFILFILLCVIKPKFVMNTSGDDEDKEKMTKTLSFKKVGIISAVGTIIIDAAIWYFWLKKK